MALALTATAAHEKDAKGDPGEGDGRDALGTGTPRAVAPLGPGPRATHHRGDSHMNKALTGSRPGRCRADRTVTLNEKGLSGSVGAGGTWSQFSHT